MSNSTHLTAVISVAGHQYQIEEGVVLLTDRLPLRKGASVTWEKVLLVAQGEKVSVGKPHVVAATVEAKVVEHLKGDKVVVFKKKRRKGYKVKNGVRKHHTKLLITAINTPKK